MKICNPNGQSYSNGNINNNKNETHVPEAVLDDGMDLSDVFNKLHNLTVGRGITYTITECLLDQVSTQSIIVLGTFMFNSVLNLFLSFQFQAFERLLDSETTHSYYNSAYTSETPT